MKHTPYTYHLYWKTANLHYYGCEFKKNAHPNNLWKTYFTSSKLIPYVRAFWGEPDVVEVRKIFNSIEKCRNWEHKVLKRLKVTKKKEWLNQTDSKSFVCIDFSFRETKKYKDKKERLRKLQLGISRKESSIIKQKITIKEYVWWNNSLTELKAKDCPGEEYVRGRLYRPSPELCLILKERMMGNKFNKNKHISDEHKLKISLSQKGKKVSIKTRLKQSISIKNALKNKKLNLLSHIQ